MDLTTVARVKLRLQPGVTVVGSELDSLLGNLITEVSAQIEGYCDRLFQYAARDEFFDVWLGRTTFPIAGFPAVDLALTSVYNDPTNESATYTQFPAATLVDRSLYAVDKEKGLIRFGPEWIPQTGPRALKVSYTGGIATGATATAGFITACPAVVGACDRQVIYERNKASNPEATSISIGGGAVAVIEERGLLRAVVAALEPYVRVAAA